MWSCIKRLFAKPEPPRTPYVHPILGRFDFDADLGWKRIHRLDGRDVEVLIGSDGESPTTDMENTASDWALNWDDLRPDVFNYIDTELSSWEEDWYPTESKRLVLSSISVLWPDSPTTAMLYFDDPDDDTRSWHATYKGREPQGFAYDD